MRVAVGVDSSAVIINRLIDVYIWMVLRYIMDTGALAGLVLLVGDRR